MFIWVFLLDVGDAFFFTNIFLAWHIENRHLSIALNSIWEIFKSNCSGMASTSGYYRIHTQLFDRHSFKDCLILRNHKFCPFCCLFTLHTQRNVPKMLYIVIHIDETNIMNSLANTQRQCHVKAGRVLGARIKGRNKFHRSITLCSKTFPVISNCIYFWNHR